MIIWVKAQIWKVVVIIGYKITGAWLRKSSFCVVVEDQRECQYSKATECRSIHLQFALELRKISDPLFKALMAVYSVEVE